MITIPKIQTFPNDTVNCWQMKLDVSGGAFVLDQMYRGLQKICDLYNVRFSVMTKFSLLVYKSVVLIFDGRSTMKRAFKFKTEMEEFCHQFS